MKEGVTILNTWFHENLMALNPGKCHYTVITDKGPSHNIVLNNKKITNSNTEKLLGILLDKKLKFESRIKYLCKTEGQKISTLAKVKQLTIKYSSKISIQ